MTTRRLRFVRVVVCALTAVLLLPSGVAVAADDPGPVQWPAIELPAATGGPADPGPTAWPPVEASPGNSGTGVDPQPEAWPAAEPN